MNILLINGMKFRKKLQILSKNKINAELMHNKKYLKAEKKSTQKKTFIVFVNE